MIAADIARVSGGIAQTLRTVPAFGVVYDRPPAQVEAYSATVVLASAVPLDPCSVELLFDIELVAPYTDFGAAFDWLYSRLDDVVSALSADPTCGGTCTGLRFGQLERGVESINIGGGTPGLALRVSLSPTTATRG